MPRTLTASSVAPRTLSEAPASQSAGTYPGSDDYPGADDYPGTGSALTGSQIRATADYIPATVPFEIYTGSRKLIATEIS